jgi:hypothetical protein
MWATSANRAYCHKSPVCHQETSSTRSGSVPPCRAAAASTAYWSLVFSGRLNAVLLAQRQDDRFLTAAYATFRVTPGGLAGRLCCAGRTERSTRSTPAARCSGSSPISSSPTSGSAWRPGHPAALHRRRDRDLRTAEFPARRPPAVRRGRPGRCPGRHARPGRRRHHQPPQPDPGPAHRRLGQRRYGPARHRRPAPDLGRVSRAGYSGPRRILHPEGAGRSHTGTLPG